MVAKVAIDLSLDRLFDYEVPEAMEGKLAVGQLLSVPFGHRTARGFAMALGDGNDAAEIGAAYKLKPVAAIVDETPFFSSKLIELAKGVAEYFAAPIESVLRAAIPAAVTRPGAHEKRQFYVEAAGAEAREEVDLTARQKWLVDQIARLGGGWLMPLCDELKTTPATLRTLEKKGALTIEERQRRRVAIDLSRVLPTKPLALNEEQAAALETIERSAKPVLLKGITGSGKTEVYLQAIARALERGGGAIVMVPEIALTPQTVQRFASRLGDKVAVLHSALSDGERYDEWHRIRAGKARVVVGPRSAVFAPVKNLALIVVDEEHETSYKQEDNPRYNARDAAVMRAAIEGARVVLGSATPSLESWANVAKGKYTLAEIKHRAGSGTLPSVSVVDMNGEKPGGGAIYSPRLLEAIGERLLRHEQTILFLNRRGYSRSLECEDCGYVAECEDCATPYAYHSADDCLRCHVCGGWKERPKVCPECGSASIGYRGVGTQRAEAALAKCFKEAKILRMDSDSTSRKNSHDDILGAFRRHEADILLGTQMIAKGLDFPNVTLVGVLNADSSLNMPDFRAAERTFQLIAQVSGRAGRSCLPGEVLLQTRNASDPTILAAARGDYEAFARSELAVRKEYLYPPYSHYSIVRVMSKDARLAEVWANHVSEALGKIKELEVAAAIPCILAKAEGWNRWQVAVKSKTAKAVAAAWRWLRTAVPAPQGVRIAIDIDSRNLI